ncbi:H-NS family nucleoid-associated regulatory protein [Paraburkholderia unamae]|uniref:DNA-binding protein H-NS n=1 Tax=Paraburkholderia unamae TaxID=219649 RepID=A0ABX5KGY1_9BURK|nr:H-NS histone family protein [Paraburkholderia unamae]PVX72847.1 DNA-binding protein H-NS [Paraburkholderia unamae]RAR54198.1 DNA-binding protein H-NS [Paraburkholderia unamae]
MPTYKDLRAQLVALEQQALEARRAELDQVLAEIREKVKEYGITQRDIFGSRGASGSSKPKSALPPKYIDPKTGATWSGRGRAPAWIADTKNRDRFLIKR